MTTITSFSIRTQKKTFRCSHVKVCRHRYAACLIHDFEFRTANGWAAGALHGRENSLVVAWMEEFVSVVVCAVTVISGLIHSKNFLNRNLVTRCSHYVCIHDSGRVQLFFSPVYSFTQNKLRNIMEYTLYSLLLNTSWPNRKNTVVFASWGCSHRANELVNQAVKVLLRSP